MKIRKGDVQMRKILVFDMDGTIADFYGVKGWPNDLENENTRPYDLAKPIYETEILNSILNTLKVKGYKIVITTWLANNSTKNFDNAVRLAKLRWLEKVGFPYDEIHLVKYGTTKANCTRKLGGYQILFDDNEKVRKGWNLGETVNANENIMEYLERLV
jgi:hypothetical protein